jgi:WD40 repeat protein
MAGGQVEALGRRRRMALGAALTLAAGLAAAGTGKETGEKPARVDRFGDPLPPGAIARLGTVRFRTDGWRPVIAVAPDGRAVASAGQRTISLWDVATGKEIRRLAGHLGGVECFAYSADGTRLVSGGNDNAVRLWDPATGREVRRVGLHEGRPGHEDSGVKFVTFVLGGSAVVSAGGDRTVRVWDAATGRELRRLRGAAGNVTALAVSPDGKTVSAATGPTGVGTVWLWDAATGAEVRRLPHPWTLDALAFSPDGKTLAVAGGNAGAPGEVRLWDVADGTLLRTLRGHREHLFEVAFSPDGKTLASAGDDDTVRLWDAAAGTEQRTIPTQRWMSTIAFLADGRTLVGRGAEHVVRFWDAATGKERYRFDGHDCRVAAVACSPDGRLLATAGLDGSVRLWDVAGGAVRRLPGPERFVGPGVRFSPDGKTLVMCGQDGSVVLTDPSTGRELRRTQLPQGGDCMALSADGKTMAVRTPPDGSLSVWDADLDPGGTDPVPGRLRCRLAATPRYAGRLAFDPDGRTLAVPAVGEPFVYLYDPATGEELRRCPAAPEGVFGVAFPSDGRTLAGACADRKLRLWEAASGQERLVLDPGGSVIVVAFSPDGRLLASANAGQYGQPDVGNADRGTVRVWDAATGKELHRFAGHQGGVIALAFTADGRRLVSGSFDTTALVWDVAGVVKAGRPLSAELPPAALEALWADLSGADAVRAYRAVVALAAAPRSAVALIQKRVRPAAAADPRRVERLLVELDSETFEVRDRAARELEKLGEGARPALRKALEGKPSAEVRRRVEQLLEKRPESADRLAEVRAVEVLEKVGTPEAKEVLTALAGGMPEARLTQEARAALRRLGRREPGG